MQREVAVGSGTLIIYATLHDVFHYRIRKTYPYMDGRIDSTVARQLRQIYGKQASGLRIVDNQATYAPVSNQVLFRRAGWASPVSELRLQRLVLWQRVFADGIEKHAQLISIVFGDLAFPGRPESSLPSQFDSAGHPTKCCNPWALQLLNDIESLRQCGDLYSIPDDMDGKLLDLVRQGDLQEEFCRADFKAVRSARCTCAIPPPGTSVSTDDFGHSEAPFKCFLSCSNGEICNAGFDSWQKLRAHQCNATGGEHGHRHTAIRCNSVNWCLLCMRLYTSVSSAKQHLRNTLHKGFCSGPGGVYGVAPMRLRAHVCECPACALGFSDAHNDDSIRKHLLLHFPPALVAQVDIAADELSDC